MKPNVITRTIPKYRIPRYLLLLGVLFLPAYLLYLIFPHAVLPFIFGFIFGYILQRSHFCFAACFRDVFLLRNTTLTRAVLLAIALTSSGFVLVNFLAEGVSLAATGKIYPLGLHTVVGGVLFGFGMVIAGSCVSGCLARMGEGYLMQWVTFSGLVLGSVLGAWHLGWWVKISIQNSPAVFLPGIMGWPAALSLHFMALALLYTAALRIEGAPVRLPSLQKNVMLLISSWREEKLNIFCKDNWSYATGAVALSVTNILLFYFWGHPWGITSGITHFSGWLGSRVGLNPLTWEYFKRSYFMRHFNGDFLAHPLVYLALAMILGSFYSSLTNRQFRLRRPRKRIYLYSALVGGTLMGYSSRVVLGCNIGAFLSGTSSLSLHGWVYGFAILCGASLGGRFLMRYLLD